MYTSVSHLENHFHKPGGFDVDGGHISARVWALVRPDPGP